MNIGLDSIVFIDDNPAERDEVRQALPEVAVPEMTADSSDYPAIIERGRYFEAVRITAEDRERSLRQPCASSSSSKRKHGLPQLPAVA